MSYVSQQRKKDITTDNQTPAHDRIFTWGTDADQKLERLLCSVEYLELRALSLINRLGPVLNQPLTAQVDDTEQEKEAPTPLGKALYDCAVRIDFVSHQFDTTLDNLGI